MNKNTIIKLVITFLAIIVGWHLLYEGYVKMLDPDWSAYSYLKTSTGPLAFVFQSMAESPWILRAINVINIYGQILIGLFLFIGLFRRYAAIGGAILLFTYYLANPSFSPTVTGYGMEGNYLVINKTLIEALILVLISIIPKNWHYGLHGIIKPEKKSIESEKFFKDKTDPKGYPLSRREVIKNLLWVPLIAVFSFLIFRNKKSILDGVSGATDGTEFDFPDDLVGEINHDIYVPNQPMGTAKGISPGRVTWVWNPNVTNPDYSHRTEERGYFDPDLDDAWFMDKNTNQELVDKMVVDGLCSITGKKNISKAWDAIFKYHNKNRGKGESSYKKGEKIFIKLNRTSAAWGWTEDYGRFDQIDSLCTETSPQISLSILRQLVNIAGVPQEDIYIGDPMTGVFKDEFEKYSSEFPDVNYLAKTGNMKGRYKVEDGSEDMIFYSDNQKIMKQAGADRFYKVLENAEYLISLAAMKGHDAAGISLCTKNHFGTQSRPKALHLHPGLNVIRINGERQLKGYGNYRVLVDLMGSKHTGGKNLFYMLDALWSGCGWNGLPEKFKMPPFNGHWTSSLFFSLDVVAIESVAFDFLRTEFSRPEYGIKYVAAEGTDDYLHQAADSKNWPEGIVYSPDGPGNRLPDSLGVHEHWNNPVDKKYSRNIGLGKGIELVKIFTEKA